MNRRDFILGTGALVAGSALLPRLISGEPGLPWLTDLHVHVTTEFPVERMVELATRRGVRLGIVEHPVEWALKDDRALADYIARLRRFPVYVGLQPIDLDWRSRYSKALIDQVDYVLHDPQIFEVRAGEQLRIWEFDTYVDDADEFMERYVEHSLMVIRTSRADIFAWPLFLPACIARDYYTLWTKARMEVLVEALSKQGVALEINDMAHTPHDAFISLAKEAGVKFTVGSDARNANVGRLGYARRLIERCKLKEEDFWLPAKKPVDAN
ncbi:MAG: hypothetical protein SFV32_11305 [Opitutaceae bacterium]|nr:hypothetical protein [Opitutaceae bacterium]